VSVPVEVTLQMLEAELEVAAQYAAAAGLVLDLTELRAGRPTAYVTFLNADREPFLAEFDFREYPLHPPTIEFLSNDRSRRGTRDLYPAGFHGTPCICMRYNRKAYQSSGGPHADWRLLDWRLPTSKGVAIDSFALMLSDLDSKIGASRGRLG